MNESDETVITEFVTVNSNVPEVLSVTIPVDQVSHNILLLDPPFFMAIMTRE